MSTATTVRTWLAERLPDDVKLRVRRAWLGHPTVPSLRDVGTLLDLYYWVAEDHLDTLVPIENIFSPFFPDEDTSTTAWMEVYDNAGRLLGRKEGIPVPHLGSPGVRVSEVLSEIGAKGKASHGNLMWLLEMPDSVARRVRSRAPFMFWDRSYIGYLGKNEVVAFVHGVDKFEVVETSGQRTPWPLEADANFTATPEMPVDLTDYPCLEVIQQNRSRSARRFELTVTDTHGKSVAQSTEIAGAGVHRFIVSRESVAELDVKRPMRLTLSGLPTRYGRPLAFKRFHNGAIAVMHC